MKERVFQVVYTERSYRDNFELGEVMGTYQNCRLSTKTTTDLKKAVADFIEDYKFYCDSGEVSVDGNVVSMFAMKTVDVDGSWCTPTSEELEKWRRGELDLWNVECCMTVHEIYAVEDKELQSIVDEVKPK